MVPVALRIRCGAIVIMIFIVYVNLMNSDRNIIITVLLYNIYIEQERDKTYDEIQKN